MGRTFLVCALAALLLVALPAPVAAQDGSAPALAIVYRDDFEGTTPWAPASGPNNPDGASWHRVIDEVDHDANKSTPAQLHHGWFASRATSTSNPEDNNAAGYDNNVDVRLTSPAISMPAAFQQRNVALTVRGSSEEGFDFLHLEWAPAIDAPDSAWTSMGTWSGATREGSYHVVLGGAVNFADHRGPFALRVRFTSNDVCHSVPEPGDLPPEVVDAAGEDPTASGDVCGIGWFVDQVDVIGRRDFTAAAAGAERVPFTAGSAGVTVDLLADRGKLVEFRTEPAQVPAGANAMLVRLDRQASADAFDLAATQDAATGVWSALLAVDEPDLTAGLWDVQFIGQSSSGQSVFATGLLTVRAQDQAAPLLTVAPTGNPVLLGPGSGITVGVTEAFVRKVTMTFSGLPTPLELPFPYHVPVASFPEGPSKVTFRAEDRTGHVASLEINVLRDTIRPTLTVLGPTTVYAGVPFDLGLLVVERSAHTIHVDVNGTKVDLTGKEGEASAGKTSTLKVTPPGIGGLTVTTRVVDALGNEALQVREFVAIEPVTDLRIVDVRLASPATNTSAEGQTVVAVVEQVGGVAPLPVTVTFEAGGRSQAYTVTVPASGPFEVPWRTNLPPGLQTIKVNARAPEDANETLPGNENGTMTVESFLGRITIGSKVYSIRSDTRGLPTTAVLSGTSKTYPLTLVQSGAGVAYQFTADGNRTVVWDPLKPVDTEPASETGTETGGGKDAPFPGLLMALAVLALAVLVQRRK